MTRKLFIPMLNLLANINAILPFLIFFQLYKQGSQSWEYLLPLLLIYAFRGVGVFLGPLLERTNLQMTVLSTAANTIGAVCSSFYILHVDFLIAGAVFLGLGSSWEWPYFLANRKSNVFAVGKKDWLVGFFLGLILVAVGGISYWQKNFAPLFLILALFHAVIWSNLIQIEDSEKEKNKLGRSERLLYLILLPVLFAAFLVVRFIRATYISARVEFLILICGMAVLCGMLIIQVFIHKRYQQQSASAISRGVVTNFIVFYAPFYSILYFQKSWIVLIYILYLLGFELGPIIYGKIGTYKEVILFLGLAACITKLFFLPGLFFCALYAGMENRYVNQVFSGYHQMNKQSFIIKYQLSTIGSFSLQLVYMLVMIGLSITEQVPLVRYFTSETVSIPKSKVWLIHLGISFIVIGTALFAVYVDRKKSGMRIDH